MKELFIHAIKTIAYTAIATIILGWGIICCDDQHQELEKKYYQEAIELQMGE